MKSMYKIGVALSALLAPQVAAFAQDAAQTDAGDIVVTAQRRAQSLQDVGISVSAFGGKELKTMGVASSLDVARLTPGVHISGNVGGQNSQFTIRGVTQNDFNDAIEAPVAVYIDDGYIDVKGTLGYAGVPRGLPEFRSSVVPAAKVIEALEQWLIEYADRNTSGVIKPYGWIGGVRGGWPGRPAFPTATTEIFFDVRINPRTTPGNVKSQFADFIAGFRKAHPDIDLDWEMYGSTPGGTTDPSNWIIQSTRRGWETIEARAYPDPDLLGGQTDGAALRRMGVPTARIGWPWPAKGSPEEIGEGLGGMGATYVPDLMPCAHKIMYAVIDTLTRPRATLGL